MILQLIIGLNQFSRKNTTKKKLQKIHVLTLLSYRSLSLPGGFTGGTEPELGLEAWPPEVVSGAPELGFTRVAAAVVGLAGVGLPVTTVRKIVQMFHLRLDSLRGTETQK